MFILITYDVNTETSEGKRRLHKVAKTCQDYGHRVQNSVFECNVTEVQLIELKSKILNIIDESADNIRIYSIKKNGVNGVSSMGRNTSFDFDSVVII